MIEVMRPGFEPLLGWPALWVALGLSAIAWLAYLQQRGRAWLTRGLALLLAGAALANPTLVQEERQPLPSVAAIVVDRSESMSFGDRMALADAALSGLRAQIEADPTLELRVIETDPRADSTRLGGALEALMADVPRDRIAGSILITDGQVHDLDARTAEALARLGPVQAVVVGDEEAGDRRIAITGGPSFDIVGETATFTLRVEDPAGGDIPVSVSLNGEIIDRLSVPAGRDMPLPVRIDRRGPNVLVVETPAGPQELTLANNRTAATVNGVRDRLRVLLITGEPHPGARVWRDLLKSDPQVDLVQFIILRPPTKTDAAPLEELALIAFPTQQLFEQSLKEFDLIIFDQYERRGVITFSYLTNMADYVDKGGALLVVAGSDFAGPASLWRTPLAGVLPVRPTGRVIEAETPVGLTADGKRHTVTRGLDAGGAFGRWYRYIEGRAEAGDVLLQTHEGDPLLVLDRVGKGRVGQLMTDQMWLWARGHDGGGPFAELIRRTVHWLMAEPELEERRLDMVARDGKVEIALYGLDDTPAALTLETPDGRTLTPAWTRDANGVFRAGAGDAGMGLYRARAGDLEAVVLNGPANPLEYADLSVTVETVAPLADATGGGVFRVRDAGDIPPLRRVAESSRAAGRDWLGLRERGAYAVTASRSQPLLPGLAGVGAILALLLLAWRREGR